MDLMVEIVIQVKNGIMTSANVNVNNKQNFSHVRNPKKCACECDKDCDNGK